MTATQRSTALSSGGFVVYLRISKEGSRTEAEVQEQLGLYERSCRSLAERKGVEVAEVISETDVSGGKAVADRLLDGAIRAVESGEREGVIVPDSERFARDMIEGCLALRRIRVAGGRFLSDDGIDSEEPSSTEFFQMRMLFAESYLRKVAGRFAERVEESVLGRGIHTGSTPPLGYDWPRTEAGKKAGPLEPTADADRVRRAFEAFGSLERPVSRREVKDMLGLSLNGQVRRVLSNRVYLGEARACGDKLNLVKEGAHPALVSIETFERVQRRLGLQASGYADRTRAPKVPKVLTKVLRCSSCGGVLTPDGMYFRCKREKCLDARRSVSIRTVEAEPYVIAQAKAAHEFLHPQWALGRAADDAVLPALEDVLRDARRKLSEKEAEAECKLPDSRWARAVAEAERGVREHEMSFGWIGQTPEAVEAMLSEGDPETVNSFLREMVRVFVSRCGRSAPKAERAVKARCKVVVLEGGHISADGDREPVPAEEAFPVPGEAEETGVVYPGTVVS